MKKQVLILWVLLFALILTACGKADTTNTDLTDSTTNTTSQVQTSAPKDTAPPISYLEYGKTYGNLTEAKKDNGSWVLVNKNDESYEPKDFEEIVGQYEDILVINTGVIKEKYPKINLETIDVSTGTVLGQYHIYEDGYQKAKNRIQPIPGIIQIDDAQTETNILINTNSFKTYNGSLIVIEGSGLLVLQASENGKLYFLDLDTDIIGGDGYDSIDTRFFEGKLRVQKDGYWGCIDENLKVSIDFSFDQLGEFHNGVAPARYGANWALIDNSGVFLTKPIYDTFDGYADDQMKYLIFDRHDVDGKELVFYDGTVIIPEDMVIQHTEDNEPFAQTYDSFYVDPVGEFIFAYCSNDGDSSVRLTVHALDGAVRYIHPYYYAYSEYYGYVGQKEDLATLEQTGFERGPILLLEDVTWSTRYYYLFEDGSVTDTYLWGTPFEAEGYAIVQTLDGEFCLIDKTGEIVHNLGTEIDNASIYGEHLVYKQNDSWYIRSLSTKEQIGPFTSVTEYEWLDKQGETNAFLLVQDAQTELYGIFYKDNLIVDTVYPQIEIDSKNSSLTFVQGANRDIHSFVDFFSSF